MAWPGLDNYSGGGVYFCEEKQFVCGEVIEVFSERTVQEGLRGQVTSPTNKQRLFPIYKTTPAINDE